MKAANSGQGVMSAYDAGGLGRNPLGIRPGVAYPLLMQLTAPDGYWVSACTFDRRGVKMRRGYREVRR